MPGRYRTNEKLTETLRVRFSETEFKELKKVASESGFPSLSDFIRMSVTKLTEELRRAAE